MVSDLLAVARSGWESIQERLFFLPPFPESIDALALFSLLLVTGLLMGEWLFINLKTGALSTKVVFCTENFF